MVTRDMSGALAPDMALLLLRELSPTVGPAALLGPDGEVLAGEDVALRIRGGATALRVDGSGVSLVAGMTRVGEGRAGRALRRLAELDAAQALAVVREHC